MKSLRALAANRDLLGLQATWASVTTVRWALAILVGLVAFDSSGASGVGLAAAVRLLAGALATPVLALRSDRQSRQRTVVVFLGLQVAFSLAVAALVAADAALPWVLVAAAAYQVGDAAQKPAQAALMVQYARTPTELAAANALWGMVDNASFLVGSLLAGVAVGATGLGGAAWICGTPLVLGLVFALRLARDEPRYAPEPGGGLSELLAGVRVTAGHPQLRLAIGLHVSTMFVQAATDVLVVVASISLFGLGQEGAGWLSALWGAGAVAGGWAVLTFVRRRLDIGVAIGLVLAGLPFVAAGLLPGAPSAFAAMLLIGAGFGVLESALLTVTQRAVPADLAGRVYGAQETLAMAAMMAGSLATAAAVASVGVRGALIAVGCVLPVLAVGCAVRLRRLAPEGNTDERTFTLLRAVPGFAQLPVATVESLALRSGRVEVAPGMEVVRQGEPANCFYVIDSGQADVFVNDTFQRTQSTGDHFGEIALLKDTPRTATVRAVTDLVLVSLDRDQFLAAVGASSRKGELNQVANQRLSADADMLRP